MRSKVTHLPNDYTKIQMIKINYPRTSEKRLGQDENRQQRETVVKPELSINLPPSSESRFVHQHQTF